MYSCRARWYLPEAGVFAERDPKEVTGLPALYAALGAAPDQLNDPYGEWNFDLSGLSRSANYLDSIEEIKNKARALLLTVPTKRYLRFRFGDSVDNAYLQRVSSDGTPPRVVFNAGEVRSSGGFALYRDGTIYLKPYFAHAGQRALQLINWKKPNAERLYEAVQWSMAVVLVHETIHFMDHDIDGQEAVDAHTAGYDIGDKWEYFLFGKYGVSWGPPHHLNQTTAPQLLKFLNWVEVAQDPELQKLNAKVLERRWSRIVSLLGRQRNLGPPPTPKESPK